jgi:hypothetical protein
MPHSGDGVYLSAAGGAGFLTNVWPAGRSVLTAREHLITVVPDCSTTLQTGTTRRGAAPPFACGRQAAPQPFD